MLQESLAEKSQSQQLVDMDDHHTPNFYLLLLLLVFCPAVLYATYHPPSLIDEAHLDLLIAAGLLLSRYVARFKTNTKWAAEDYLALLALPLAAGLAGCVILITRNGTAKELPNNYRMALDDKIIEAYILSTKSFYAGLFFYVGAIWCLKGCMLIFYSRLSNHKWWRRFLKLNVTATAIFLLVNIGALLGHCRPFKKNWQVRPDPGGECDVGYIPNVTIVVGDGSTNIIFILMAIPFLWQGSVKFHRRLAVAVVLLLAILTTAISVIRCVLGSTAGLVAHPEITSIWALREFVLLSLITHLPIISTAFRSPRWRSNSRALPVVMRGLSPSRTVSDGSVTEGLRRSKSASTSSANERYRLKWLQKDIVAAADMWDAVPVLEAGVAGEDGGGGKRNDQRSREV